MRYENNQLSMEKLTFDGRVRVDVVSAEMSVVEN
jgi:hypothetical protein